MEHKHDSRWDGRLNANLRLAIVRYATLVGLLSAFALAPRLWMDHPLLGTMSVFGNVPRITGPWDRILFAVLVVLVLPMFSPRRAERWIRIWCVAMLLRCCWDRITWQPYFFQYFCMLLVMGWYGSDANSQRKGPAEDATSGDVAEGQLNALRLIVFSVYFYSGVAKFNYRFFDVAAEISFGELLPAAAVKAIDAVIWLIPVVETLMAVGLLFPRTRKMAVVTCLVMHVVILWMIGPLGMDYNRVVWPWNLVMMVVVPALFWNASAAGPFAIFGWRSKPVHKLVLVLCTVMPALSYAGLWPSYLSFQMYAERGARGLLEFRKEFADSLPEHVQEQVQWHPQGLPIGQLSIMWWSEKELGAFVPSQVEVFKQIGRRCCQSTDDPTSVVLIIYHRPNMWTGESHAEKFTCADL